MAAVESSPWTSCAARPFVAFLLIAVGAMVCCSQASAVDDDEDPLKTLYVSLNSPRRAFINPMPAYLCDQSSIDYVPEIIVLLKRRGTNSYSRHEFLEGVYKHIFSKIAYSKHGLDVEQSELFAELIRVGGKQNLIQSLKQFESNCSQLTGKISKKINYELLRALNLLISLSQVHDACSRKPDSANVHCAIVDVIQDRHQILTSNMAHHRRVVQTFLNWMETEAQGIARDRARAVEETIKQIRKCARSKSCISLKHVAIFFRHKLLHICCLSSYR